MKEEDEGVKRGRKRGLQISSCPCDAHTCPTGDKKMRRRRKIRIKRSFKK